MTNVPNAPEVAQQPATQARLPELPGCGAEASVRFEIYRSSNGSWYGSLAGAVNVCAEHADAARAAASGAGFLPFLLSGPVSDRPCGSGMDFTGDRPEPLATRQEIAARLFASAGIDRDLGRVHDVDQAHAEALAIEEAAEPQEHRHVGGSGGAAGECSAECACGVTFDGFDTIAEANKLLGDHIAQEARANADGAGQQQRQMVSAAAAGQPALVRIARTNMLRAITRMSFAVDRDALPAPTGVRFDTKRHAVVLEFDTIDAAEAWSTELKATGAERDDLGMVSPNGRRWSYYSAQAEWRGFAVSLVALVPVDTEQPATVPA